MCKQTKANNLNYLIDSTFSRANRSFVLSFENKNDRISFSKYYTQSAEINNFTVLIDGKKLSWCSDKKKKNTHEANIEMSKNNIYTTGNFLDNEYFPKHYKLIAIDLSKQIELENPNLKQQVNFIGKLEDNEATMFFIIKKSKETTFNFSQVFVSII